MFAWKSGEGYEFQKEPWHLGQCFKAHRLRSTLCQSKMAVEKSPGPWFSQLWTSLNFHVLPFSSGTTGTYHYIIIYNITITAYSYIYIFLFTYNNCLSHIISSNMKLSPPKGDLWPRPQRRAATSRTGRFRAERRGRGGLARDPATSCNWRKWGWVNGGLAHVNSWLKHRVDM